MTRWISLACAAALMGCSGSDDDDGKSPPPPDDGLVSSFEVVPGPISGVMIATVETTEAVTATVAYGLKGESLATTVPTVSAEGTTHTFTILGVKTGREYDFQAVLTTADGEATSDVVTTRVAATEVSVPTFTLEDNLDPTQQCGDDGFVLLSYLGNNNSGVAIIDRDGDVVWSIPFANTNVQVARARPGRDGGSVTYTTADGRRVDEIGEQVRQPLNGSDATVTKTNLSHHDYVELPSGGFGWLGYAFDEWDRCTSGNVRPNVAVDTIMESPEGGADGDATQVYNMLDDYGSDLNCGIDDENFLQARGYFDLTHSNSLMYRESDDAYFHMMRWHDGLVKVDRASGDKVWQLGGLANDFTPAAGQDAAELFNHSHMSEIWDDGLLIFNNNDFGPNGPGPSIVQEYALDESAMTWDVVWSWTSDQGFEALLGDARRMPQSDCDNVLVSLSGSGIVRELTRDGTAAWGVSAPLGNVTSRVHYVPDIYDLTTALRD